MDLLHDLLEILLGRREDILYLGEALHTYLKKIRVRGDISLGNMVVEDIDNVGTTGMLFYLQ
jgi:hypothetical protein